MKPFSVTLNKNYTPSLPKPFVTCPFLPYQNLFVAMRLILPPTGSYRNGSLHISLLYSDVHFSISSQAALMPRGSFYKHLQSNFVLILLKLSKAYFRPANFFFSPMAKLFCAKTPVCHANQECFIASFCFPICLLPSCLSYFDCKLSRAGFVIFQLVLCLCRTLRMRLLLHYQNH